MLLLVFDTLSANHLPIHGYPRETAPNLARFSERATVFHAHHSAGNFTTPGTASLLTGAYPWSHRAVHIQGTVAEEYRSSSIFDQLKNAGYYQLAYTHNLVAASLLDQFRSAIDLYPPVDELALAEFNHAENLFRDDLTPAIHSEGLLTRRGDSFSSSLFLHRPRRWLESLRTGALHREYAELFPRGLPGQHNLQFRLEDAMDWTMDQLAAMPSPFFAYLHFYPPHDPYHPRREFIGKFDDGWSPPPKPEHALSDQVPQEFLDEARMHYDENIGYVDAEFGRLLSFLETSGLLDTTYVMVTSDHGELFERGIWNHITPVLFEPVIRVPFIVSAPGQREGRTVRTPTSGVDIMPTVLHISGLPVPDWCEGEVLATVVDGTMPNPERHVFCVEAKQSSKFGQLRVRSTSLLRDHYKLVHYQGYERYDDVYELYDLREDPEELADIFAARPGIAADLVAIMASQWASVEAAD